MRLISALQLLEFITHAYNCPDFRFVIRHCKNMNFELFLWTTYYLNHQNSNNSKHPTSEKKL